MSDKVTKHLVISGRVQGVCYRDEMCRAAATHGVTGWVRNRRDGTVEAMVQGEPQAVEAVIRWARRGPPAASVTEVQVEPGSGDYPDFSRHPTL